MTEWTLWALGATDYEMSVIERVLRDRLEAMAIALRDGNRVTPATAYQVDALGAYDPDGQPWDAESGISVVWVECAASHDCRWGSLPSVIVDHHRPGDPGHGRPPAEYLQASSLGQVLALLGVEPTQEHRYVAAADHCLAAAYAGQCPGVDPDELRPWREQQISPRLGLAWAEFHSMVSGELAELGDLPGSVLLELEPGVTVIDRRSSWAPSLALDAARREAACIAGVAYVAQAPSREGEGAKIVLGGAGEGTVPGRQTVRAFLRWAQAQGYVRPYGDDRRGFAGAYHPK